MLRLHLTFTVWLLIFSLSSGAEPSVGAVHWAFVPVVRPKLPVTQRRATNSIDRFIVHKLESRNIRISLPSNRTTLLRRITLDTTGLPPAPEDVASFCADTRPDAYERIVDRLLASPHFGERWGRHWLDSARYADSEGFEFDPFRSMWRYRQYVVDTINQDLPVDQFVIEQIAGDLLPNATDQQKIATAFCRNNLGASNHEPTRLEGVVDRVNTMGTVFMGLTVSCAQCHTHKFDPVSQREYYELFAFFNNSEDPALELARSEVPQSDMVRFKSQVRQLEEQFSQLEKELESSLDEWLRQLTNADIAKLPEEVRPLCKVPLAQQSNDHRAKLLTAYGNTNPQFTRLKSSLAAHQKQVDSLLTVPVLAEMSSPRETTMFIRGDFANKGSIVHPNVPAVLPPIPAGDAANRLDLARWLTSSEHPLTARVMLNRVWQQYFGVGIVETENDFGTQGAAPSHPKLLDWLAADFMENGWQLKRLHRLILNCQVYRQSSDARPDLSATDPSNRLLARQNRLRLEAEAIRDQALIVSGRLDRQIGGPSVFPSQASDVMEGRADKTLWIVDDSSAAQRRGLYIHFWRLTPHPYLVLFDAPDATISCTRRQRSNTPMQALALLNHPWFTKCARTLAIRILNANCQSDNQRLDWVFSLCLGRLANSTERSILVNLLAQQRQQFQNDISRATKVVEQTSQISDREVVELAAWSAVTRTLLNLDEFITRE